MSSRKPPRIFSDSPFESVTQRRENMEERLGNSELHYNIVDLNEDI